MKTGDIHQHILRTLIPIGVVVADKLLNIIFCNRAAEILFGPPAEDAVGKNVKDIHAALGMDSARLERAMQIVEETSVYKSEIKVQRGDETIFISFEVRKISKGYVLMAQNITGYKTIGEALNVAQHIANVGSWNRITVGRKNVCWWSDEIYKMFQAAPQSFGVNRQTFLSYVYSKDRKAVKKAFKKALLSPQDKNCQAYDMTYRIIIGGEIKYVRERIEVVRDQNGRSIRLNGTVQDVTDWKKETDKKEALNKILSISAEQGELEDILNKILRVILDIEWLSVKPQGCIFAINKDKPQILEMLAHHNLAIKIRNACGRLNFGTCLCGLAAQEQKVIFADRVDERHSVSFKSMEDHGHYCVPIISEGKTLGVLDLYLAVGHKNDQREVDFLMSAANTIASAIRNKQIEEKIIETQHELEKTLSALQATIRCAPIGIMISAGGQTITNPRFNELWENDGQAKRPGLKFPEKVIRALEKIKPFFHPVDFGFEDFLRKLKDPMVFIDLMAQSVKDPRMEKEGILELHNGKTLKYTTTPQELENKEIVGRVWLFEDITREVMRKRIDKAISEFSNITHQKMGIYEILEAAHQIFQTIIPQAKYNFFVAILRDKHTMEFLKHIEDGHKQETHSRDMRERPGLSGLLLRGELDQYTKDGYVSDAVYCKISKRPDFERCGEDLGPWCGKKIINDGEIIGVVGVEGGGLKNTQYLQDFMDKMSDQLGRVIEHFLQTATDPLTQLLNRQAFEERVNKSLNEARRYKRSIAVLFLDLDGFKEVNDKWGHEAGDAVLKEAAARIKKATRNTDIVSRRGGDEFTIFIPQIDSLEDVAKVVCKIINALSVPIGLSGGESAQIGVSIGAALYPEDVINEKDVDAEMLIKKADIAMYHAKQTGKNRLVFYNPKLKKEEPPAAAKATARRGKK